MNSKLNWLPPDVRPTSQSDKHTINAIYTATYSRAFSFVSFFPSLSLGARLQVIVQLRLGYKMNEISHGHLMRSCWIMSRGLDENSFNAIMQLAVYI